MTPIAFVILLLGALENLWPLIVGYAQTPNGSVFLGTIHHAPDYLYYLSQFAQGASRWMTTRDLYTPENIPPSLVGWSNVLFGRIGWIFRLSPQVTYGVSVIALTFLALLAAYSLIREFTHDTEKATVAYALFVFYHAFPLPAARTFTYSDYWNNVAVPFVRLGGVPHQLLIVLSSFLLMRSALRWIRLKHIRDLVIIGLCSVVLGSLQPVLWAVVAGALLFAFSWQILIAFMPGLIPVIYLTLLFHNEPFVQLRIWEAAQHSVLSASHFLLSTGPLFMIALLTVLAFGGKWLKRPDTRMMLLFPLISFGLFLSPVSSILNITEVRFLSALSVLCVSVIAALGISSIPKTPRYLFLIAVMAVLIPGHLVSLRQYSAFDKADAFRYLSVSDYIFLQHARSLGTDPEKNLFLVIWPYNVIFPAVTGERSWNGHPLLTIDSSRKDGLSQAFFGGTMNEENMLSLLRTYNVTYVIAYTWSPKLASLPFLVPVYTRGNLVYYNVHIANGL